MLEFKVSLYKEGDNLENSIKTINKYVDTISKKTSAKIEIVDFTIINSEKKTSKTKDGADLIYKVKKTLKIEVLEQNSEIILKALK